MHTKEIITLQSTYREDMKVKGFLFGKGDKAACIVGSFRGNEIQQMYIPSGAGSQGFGKQRGNLRGQTDIGDT